MKITVTELSEIIKEHVKKIISEAPVKKPDPLQAAKALLADMRSARAKGVAAGRDPSQRAAASKKGAETRAARKSRRDEFMQNYKAEQDRREAALAARRDKGLLPLVVIGYNGEPDEKFYEPAGAMVTGPDGFSIPKFRLKSRFEDRKFNAAAAQMILNRAEPIFDPELM